MSTDNPREVSFRLQTSDREKLTGWLDITRPENEQIYAPEVVPKEPPKKPTAAVRLATTKALAARIVTKIDQLKQAVDKKCARFKASSNQGVGSPLFQAMVRVFDERTTTVTYDHYKRALEYRQQLAEEDAAKLRLE